MPRRIDLGRAVLVAGAALLLISLFTEWYDTGPTGWDVFETLDLVLAGIALAGIVAAVRPDAVPPWVGWGLPALAVAIVLVQLVNAPPAAGDGSPSTGAWLALAGGLLMAGGAALSVAAISVTVQVRERDVRRRVPAVDRRGHDDELADEAEDLDADADGPVSPPRRGGSLGIGLAPHAGDEAEEPPAKRTRRGRLGPRDSPAVASGTPAPAKPEAVDLERTQPLTDLPGDEGDAERP
jgi:hypothetical protein